MAKEQRPKARSNRRARMWTADLRGPTPPGAAPARTAPPGAPPDEPAPDEPAADEPTPDEPTADAAPPPTDEPTAGEDPWVTGPPPVAQHVPGIDEAPETTYVDPTTPSPRRAILVGVGVGLGMTAIVAAIVLGAGSTEDAPEAGPSVTLTRPTSTTAPTPTTTAPATTATTSAPVAPAPTAAPTAAPAGTPAPAPAPTPPATANPAAPVFVNVPLPNGVSATLTTCAWQPTNGGQYEAGGTVTNAPSTNKGWTLTMHWLQNQREIAKASTVVALGAGQSKPWSVTHTAPNPPADLTCSLTAD